ncbi:hypothetical protein I3760_06G158400 [Carya illinoinensis]|uniref:Uncharacterized protein n=3 Tax=Carya illinoinensis TaxID=32201 RepID=A0A8T1QC08_CARIL|nr:transcription factor bHLH143-like isoform X1 [Carya illinoinensis]XP_042984420.1 transcription factor bHLH143-like isoform X1 [Carya illinoinensis]KAG2703889.1 hypothetical protein I3760_06G158400 [Carya illinoinensis]KAG6652050.1 hypothetical protein CIPAW_06G156800 [Carya illinoinensis]KAG6709937.1 hypothetical protein I3842_06G157900 [Carya illinoinensis]
MVKASGSRLSLENSAWKPSKLSFMNTDLRLRQQECLPACTNLGNRMSPAPMAQPNFAVPGIPDLKTEQTNGAHGSLQCLPLQFQGLLPTPDPYLKTKKSMLSNSGLSAKRFLIFDQCGNQTRLVCFPSPNPNTAAKPICCYYGEEQAARVSQIDPSKYILHEASGDNITTFEESEMHEDTEEINALLYSDNDEYGDGDDDETASTGHSPVVINGRYEKHDHVDYLTDEVAGPDGPNKRQKFLDGGYKRLSPMDTTSSIKLDRSVEYGSDAESGYAFGQNQGEKAGSILGKMCFRRDKICETLRILEHIIPGAEGKDPLFVIDEAIDYLKILKLNAKSLGVNNQ